MTCWWKCFHIYFPFLLASAVTMAQGVMMLRCEQAITPKSRGNYHDLKNISGFFVQISDSN